MAAITPEVWEPNPIIPVPGTYVPRFNRYYLSINPNPAEGPPTWRISDPDEYPCDGGAILPPGIDFMLAAEAPVFVELDADDKPSYGFNIDLLTDIDAPFTPNSITTVENLEEPIFLSNKPNTGLYSVYDNNDKSTVTVFDIYPLNYLEGGARDKQKMKVTVYNENRSTPVVGNEPIIAQANTASTDLFFDISSLPHES